MFPGFPDGHRSHYVRNIVSSFVLAEGEGGEPTMLILPGGGRSGPPVSEAAWVAYLKCTLQGLPSQTY